MVLLKALGISNRFSIDFNRLCASMKGIDFGIDGLGQFTVDVSFHVNKSLCFYEKNPQVVVLERDAHKAFQPLHSYQNGCNLCFAKFPYQASLDILRAVADVYPGPQLLQRLLVLVERSIFDV
jgi:hypothetical protein